jgi:hypothetical protein
MVCFTEHLFTFSKREAQYWFQLLIKYYKDVEVTVNNEVQGKLSNEFLALVPEADKYQVVTERFWDQLATLRAVPKFGGIPPLEKGKLSANGQKACDAINQIILSRLSFDGAEVFLQSEFAVDAEEFPAVLQACKFDPQIVTHFIYEKEGATKTPQAFVVLKQRHGLLITLTKVCDSSLGVLDLDEGFHQNGFGSAYIPQYWANQFHTWKTNLDTTQGRSWDTPILMLQFP